MSVPMMPVMMPPVRNEIRFGQALEKSYDGLTTLAATLVVRVASSSVIPNAPATPTEQAIARVWSELLHTTNLERQDNFFHLGGTSLLAMQAVARLEQELGMRINARRYVYESLAQLAAAYDQGETAAPVVVTAKPSLIKRIAGIFQSRGNSAN